MCSSSIPRELHENCLRHRQVDNMFAPNHYESYCAALDKNVNCIAVLLVRSTRPGLNPLSVAAHCQRCNVDFKGVHHVKSEWCCRRVVQIPTRQWKHGGST